MTQCGTLVSVNGESRIAWGISERERAVMKHLGQKGGDTNAKD